jgi:hypothetical protein
MQVEVRPAVGLANSLHMVQAYPDYGSGAGGWGEDPSLAGDRLAGLGVGAAEERGETPFYAWLLGQARDLDASLLLSALPE